VLLRATHKARAVQKSGDDRDDGLPHSWGTGAPSQRSGQTADGASPHAGPGAAQTAHGRYGASGRRSGGVKEGIERNKLYGYGVAVNQAHLVSRVTVNTHLNARRDLSVGDVGRPACNGCKTPPRACLDCSEILAERLRAWGLIVRGY
jgi:hypothetical protein